MAVEQQIQLDKMNEIELWLLDTIDTTTGQMNEYRPSALLLLMEAYHSTCIAMYRVEVGAQQDHTAVHYLKDLELIVGYGTFMQMHTTTRQTG